MSSLDTGQESNAAPVVKREKSTTPFPYVDLEEAERLATETFKAGGACTLDQLANALKHDTVESGAFRLKVAAGQLFGLVAKDSNKIELTKLGNALMQPELRNQARVTAFLTVPLYRRVYDKFRGNLLPPDPGFDKLLVDYGVSSKQGGRARQIMQRSAGFAGLFPQGVRNKLILPTGIEDIANISTDDGKTSEGQAADATRVFHSPIPPGSTANLPPAILGVLTTLPLGEDDFWTLDDLKEWTSMFEIVIKRSFKNKIRGEK